ncbi:MAG: leucine-rich repeat domain-containing protein [Bacteroidales bacterium]|nr:leucine-rich repeat domain-containing protein [Candidatus Scybalocola fimicaballi]
MKTTTIFQIIAKTRDLASLRQIAFATALLSSFSLFAEKIEVDGIYYNLKDDGTAEVTYRGDDEDGWMYFSADNLYVGDVEIPSQFEYSGATYQVTSLGNDAFAGSKYMTSLFLPSTLSSIGTGIFSLCNSLEYISVDDMNPNFISQDGVLYKRNPLSISFVPRNISGDISLLDDLKEISSGAFQNCVNLTSITLPSEVTTIADGAFNNCVNLQEIFMNDKLESIGEYAFSKCNSLTIIDLPESVKSIKAAAFADCASLSFVLIHEGLQSIGKMAFYNCQNIGGIQLPSTLTTIGEQAFKECTSLDVVLNDSDLPIEIGSTDYGYVAYYASDIIKTETSVCNIANDKNITISRSGNRWIISNASGKYVTIYSVNGQKLKRFYCETDREEMELEGENGRIIVVE